MSTVTPVITVVDLVRKSHYGSKEAEEWAMQEAVRLDAEHAVSRHALVNHTSDEDVGPVLAELAELREQNKLQNRALCDVFEFFREHGIPYEDDNLIGIWDGLATLRARLKPTTGS